MRCTFRKLGATSRARFAAAVQGIAWTPEADAAIAVAAEVYALYAADRDARRPTAKLVRATITSVIRQRISRTSLASADGHGNTLCQVSSVGTDIQNCFDLHALASECSHPLR